MGDREPSAALKVLEGMSQRSLKSDVSSYNAATGGGGSEATLRNDVCVPRAGVLESSGGIDRHLTIPSHQP